MDYHRNQFFSTLDRDNDVYGEGECAENNFGGWWYTRCFASDLNGEYDRANVSGARLFNRDLQSTTFNHHVQIKIRPL